MSKRPTPAQDAARMRNWGIRSLRALYALAYQLNEPRRAQVQSLIDEELAARGAERQSARRAADQIPF